jgi:hypothetical protein
MIHKARDERICKLCLEYFEIEKYEEHLKTHEWDKPNMCSFCRESFPTKELLEQHVRNVHHQGINSSDRPENSLTKSAFQASAMYNSVATQSCHSFKSLATCFTYKREIITMAKFSYERTPRATREKCPSSRYKLYM